MARKPGRALTHEKWAEFSSKNGGFNQQKLWFYGGFMVVLWVLWWLNQVKLFKVKLINQQPIRNMHNRLNPYQSMNGQQKQTQTLPNLNELLTVPTTTRNPNTL